MFEGEHFDEGFENGEDGRVFEFLGRDSQRRGAERLNLREHVSMSMCVVLGDTEG